MLEADPTRIRNAWLGRISGCELGKPVEGYAMRRGHKALRDYLERAGALPLRDYVPFIEGELPERVRNTCRGYLERAEPDDDINYTALALLLLEKHGRALTTADVAREWLMSLPAGQTWTAERAAYRVLLNRADDRFPVGGEPGFDLADCAQNEFNDWIGAQIRADLYGWVCPGDPSLAAHLVRRDAELSHVAEGVYGAVLVAALGAAIPAATSLDDALDRALQEIPAGSGAAEAVALGRSLVGVADAVERLHAAYPDMSPVHTLNNLAVVVWALRSWPDDCSAAVGEAVAAGWDTDCNGATVGGLWGLSGKPIPAHWTEPWGGRVHVGLAGWGEMPVGELVERTLSVAGRLAADGKN
ncbi:MAG: ADP-ribosylglycohydrolase family protein [Dehalococcoidia bacterium]